MNTLAMYLPGVPNLNPSVWTQAEKHTAFLLMLGRILAIPVVEVVKYYPPPGGHADIEYEGLEKHWVLWVDGFGVGHCLRPKKMFLDEDEVMQEALTELAKRRIALEAVCVMGKTLAWLRFGIDGDPEPVVKTTIETFLADMGRQLRTLAKNASHAELMVA